ncbi:MAG: SDR family NAD(P)-dependent oxidoreductase [Myxococcales bacterium]|nr:SDR family NAD(P)-dependent oxidoreductase [Myxococcales bacterium]
MGEPEDDDGEHGPTDAQITSAIAVLEASRALPPDDPRFLALEAAAAHLRKATKRKRRLERARATAAHDRAVRASTELARERGMDGAASGGTRTLRERDCYVCKRPYRDIDARYHLLCPTCAARSGAMRDLRLDLAGRRALVTGGRVKIGHATALRLLRAGAEVVVTTRFPTDAAARFAEAPDHADWAHRLAIHGLDFRRLGDVLEAIAAFRDGPPLDILVNNAAQTVWHAPSWYADLLAGESAPPALPVTVWSPPGREHALEPLARLVTVDGERVPSWVMELEDVPPSELVECQVVNAIVPALLCSRLLPAFRRSPFPDRYIVNVAALEGQFAREKLSRHPHTNMAKAALAMLTATSASGYAKHGVHMVSVDPGWMSHEAPEEAAERARAGGFHPPLDAEDAAVRILHPIALGLDGRPVSGVLLKDFDVVPW